MVTLPLVGSTTRGLPFEDVEAVYAEHFLEHLGTSAAGFTHLSWHAYGESDDPRFERLEQHETYPDTPDLPHVVVVEGRKGKARPEELATFREMLEEEVGRYLE